MRRQVLLFVLVICSAPGIAQEWRNFNTTNSGLLSNSLSSMTFNGNVLWAAYAGAGGSGLGIVKYENNTWTNYNTANSGLPNNDVRAMVSDHLGNMWFGCYEGGLVKFNGTTWTLYNTANSGLAHNNVSSITVDNHNNIWVGMYFGGVSKFDGTTWTTFNSSNAPFPSSNCINDIIVDQDFTLWVGLGCGGGLAKRAANGVWTSYTTANSDIAHHTVSALITDPNGSLWIGYITNVISNLQGSTWTHHALPAGASTSYHGFSVDHTGTIWCGAMGEGLLYYTGSAWLKEDVAGSGNTNSIFSQSTGIDEDNMVWWGEMNQGLWKLEGLSWIADNNLRACIKESYPSIFNAQGYVITALAQDIDIIQCIDRGIKDLEGIQVFANLTSVSFGSNALTEIHEVSSLVKLTALDIPNNEIATLPNFSVMPDLRILNLAANKILTFPDLTACPGVTWINVLTNKITSVPDLSSFTELTHLAVGYNPLVTLPSLSQNTKLTYLNIQDTDLTTFPDLSANLLLEHVYFGENPQFSEWPDIATNVKLQYIACDSNGMATIPDLSIYPSLTYLSCAHNKLTQLPDLSIFQNLNVLVADHNDLTSLPDLQATQIGVDVNSILKISNNHLTFEDLVPVVPGKIFGLLEYQDQTLPVENIIASKKTGETFSLDINVDHTITGNTYRWVKDTSFVMTTNNDNLTVQNLTQTDAGIYRCEITNASLPQLTLIWKQATLTICADVTWDGFDVLVTSASCISGGKILVTNNGTPATSVNEFILEDVVSGARRTSTVPEIVELAPAHYNLSMNIEGCGLDWPETIEIVKDQSCDSPVISPNNDGTAEDFYIPYQGLAKIYNRDGQVVNEIAVPSAWRGTDGSGNPLPMGVYIIVCDGQRDITITVIR